MCSQPAGLPSAELTESDEVQRLLQRSPARSPCGWSPWAVARPLCRDSRPALAATLLVAGALVAAWGASSGAGAAAASGLRAPLRVRGSVSQEVEGKDQYENFGEFGAYTLEDVDGGWCGNSPMLNDFSSLRGMEVAGWWFNWTDDFTFKPLMYKDFVPPYSYWGFEMKGSGAVSLRVKGEGVLTLDYGNLLGTPGSQVSVYLNLQKWSTAGPSVLSKTVDIPFHDADALTILQEHTGIIVINRVSFRCTYTSTQPPTQGPPEDGSAQIWTAEQRWKEEHAKLQKAAVLATKKQQEHYAAVKLAKAQRKIREQDREMEKDLELQKRAEEQRARASAEEDQAEAAKLVKALLAVLSTEGKEATPEELALAEGDLEQKDAADAAIQAALKRAEAAERLAQELRLAAETDPNGAAEDIAEAERLEQVAQDERVEAQVEQEKVAALLQQDETVKQNESWAEEQMRNAEAQAERTAQELREAEAAEDAQARTSAEAAKRMKDALQDRTDEANKQKEKEKQLQKQKEEEAAKHASEQSEATTTTTRLTTTTKKRRLGDLLYCFALMLPFGYEPDLLAAQMAKNVGIYECDRTTVFTNSSLLLDTGKPVPVEVELLDFTLAVPYGGKWHTALNTGVFNSIWKKVHDMKVYLDYDWVVKADPDTVWFPKRLVEVLHRGLPKGSVSWIEQEQVPMSEERPRRLTGGRPRPPRKLQELKQSDTCRTCKMPGHESETCDAHVWWLQDTKGLTCEEALSTVRREPPADCGCECSRLEACDLSADANWSQDGHWIKGNMTAARMPVYINNCRFGLHGPIEVLSAGAVTAYVDGLPKCEFLLTQPWGEDKYLDRCMLALGVTRLNVFGMLSEIACGEEPAPCEGPDVAFHPFKKYEEYFACWAMATTFGKSPVTSRRRGLNVETAELPNRFA